MTIRIAFPLVLFQLGLCSCASAPEIETRNASTAISDFGGASILVLSDGDMAATAYADGKLYPKPGSADTLLLLDSSGRATNSIKAVPNSVTGWPGALDISPDGRFAYVIATHGSPSPDVNEVESVFEGLPAGNLLTTIDLRAEGGPRVVASTVVGASPMSVQAAPNGRWLLVASNDSKRDLVIVALERGVPTQTRSIDIELPTWDVKPQNRGVRFAQVRSAGDVVALNISNEVLAFVNLVPGADGRPIGAVLTGPLVDAGRWLSMGRWSRDGRHFLISDVGWGPGSLDAALNGPGQIASIQFSDSGAHRIVSKTTVSLSPEGFELSPAGDLLAVINMERTYLPSGFPYAMCGPACKRDPVSGVIGV